MMSILTIILLLVGFVFLIKGADMFVEGASDLATKLKIPAMIIGLSNVSQISAKNTHNLLLKQDGTVLGWGRSTYGQLGTNTDSVLSPSSCSFPGNISKIEAGSNISVAIT